MTSRQNKKTDKDDPFLLAGEKPVAGPFLGLDVGDARVGVAVSDALGMIARPLATVERIPRKACLDRFESLIRETGTAGAVVGLPLLEGGGEGSQAENTRAFIRSLQRRLPGLRITWWDERFTTSQAAQLREELGERPERGGSSKQRAASSSRSRRDELAAAFILQEWLDERARRRAK